MYESDLEHPQSALYRKLKALYELRADKTLDLGFRPEYVNLLKAFGNPHERLPPTIHVAGTNGKGSTIATLRAILENYGLRVHVYTSPHLHRFNERIILAGKEIGDEALEALVDKALALNNGAKTTFFEITTAMAFHAFASTPADVLLLETGLGGRLDCTNIISSPFATIITALGLDHQEHLGPTLAHIAYEKAGIIKNYVPCIIAPQECNDETEQAIRIIMDRAASASAPLYLHGSDWSIQPDHDTKMRFNFGACHSQILPKPNLVGPHQVNNAGTALAALYVLKDRWPWDEQKIRNAMDRIIWKGRFQHIENTDFIPEGIELWFDGGHNTNAARAISAQLKAWRNENDKPLHLVFGMKGDKDASSFLSQIGPFAHSITHIDIEGIGQSLSYEELSKITRGIFEDKLPPTRATDLKSALLAIKSKMRSNETVRVLLCGSLYLAKQIPEN